MVDPQLYIAFGISGAVQHTSGLGQPQHIISVNTDPHCPMMQLADLAVVSDANAVLDELLVQICGVDEAVADFDVIVVGAGPAGSCAAIEAARGGLRMLLLERGPFPGSKNMYGGVIYPRILDELIPEWWHEAPFSDGSPADRRWFSPTPRRSRWTSAASLGHAAIQRRYRVSAGLRSLASG